MLMLNIVSYDNNVPKTMIPTVDKKVIVRHVLTERNGSASVISEVKDPGLDTEPRELW